MSILSSDGASFSFQGLRYRVIERRVDSTPHPSPNRVLKFCVSNCLAKKTLISSDGARIVCDGARWSLMEPDGA